MSEVRLADSILSSLKIAIDQEDAEIAEKLKDAMEMAILRGPTSGLEEKRDYTEDMEKTMERFWALKGS